MIWTWRLWLLISLWMERTSSSIPLSQSQSPWRQLQQDPWGATPACPKLTRPPSRVSTMWPASYSPCPPPPNPQATTSVRHLHPGLEGKRESPARGMQIPMEGHTWWGICTIPHTRPRPAPRCPPWVAVRICSGHQTRCWLTNNNHGPPKPVWWTRCWKNGHPASRTCHMAFRNRGDLTMSLLF